MYSAYLFDLDGTLVDTAPDLMESLNYALQRANHPTVDIELTRHWTGHGGRVMIEESLKYIGVPKLEKSVVDAFYDDFLDHYKKNLAINSKPYPNTEKTLKTLFDNGSRLGVVTNKFYDLSLSLLKALGMYQYFGVLVGGDTIQVRKPRPEPLLYACNRLNTSIESTLFVGDSQTDVDAARAAGIDVIAVSYGYNHSILAKDLGADKVIDSLDELIQ